MIITPGFIVYLFVCYLVAFFGRNRKFGFWINFGLSILFTPVIGFIIVLGSDKRVAAPAPAPVVPAPTTPAPTL